MAVNLQLTIKPEYRDMFPPMSELDFKAFKQSIKNNGQDYPIIINEKGVIIDGYHRDRACRELGTEPKYEVRKFKDELEEIEFILDSNLERRHLNAFQRVEAVLKSKSLVYLQEKAKKNMSLGGKGVRNLSPLRVDEETARLARVSRDTVRKVQTILEKGGDDEIKKARLREHKINKVADYIRKKEARQRIIEDAKKTSEEFLKTPNIVIIAPTHEEYITEYAEKFRLEKEREERLKREAEENIKSKDKIIFHRDVCTKSDVNKFLNFAWPFDRYNHGDTKLINVHIELVDKDRIKEKFEYNWRESKHEREQYERLLGLD